MQIYQATPDYYNEYLSHSRENHKYIDKHMGKNGKWVYRYESPKKTRKDPVNPYVALDEAATHTRKKISEGARALKRTAKKAWKNSNVYKIANDKKMSKGKKVFELYRELSSQNDDRRRADFAASLVKKGTKKVINNMNNKKRR